MFYKLFHESLKYFPKQENILWGQRIESTILDVLEKTLEAACLPKLQKHAIIRQASNKIDLLKHLIRLAHETKSINDKRYLRLQVSVIEIGKMVEGWLKSN